MSKNIDSRCNSCDPDAFLDLEVGDLARKIERLENEIFETEKNALTDWHAKLEALHKEHFETVGKYEAFEKRLEAFEDRTGRRANS